MPLGKRWVGTMLIGAGLLQKTGGRAKMGSEVEACLTGVSLKGRPSYGRFVGTAVYGISYRDLEQMMGERGVAVDHSTIFR